MIDLTRLMFDDGASRPAIDDKTALSFSYGGNTYYYRVVRTVDEAKALGIWNQERTGLWMWGEDYQPHDSWNARRFLEDPTGWSANRGFVVEHVDNNFQGGTVVFILIEKVS